MALALLCSRADAAKHTIRWVLVHNPSIAADQSARDFAERVEKETNGDIHVEVIAKDRYAEFDFKPVTPHAMLSEIARGAVEMGQPYSDSLSQYNRKFMALSQPYLFKDYDHAENVFEGPLGAQILAMVPLSSGLRALGITYSGGYGVFATKDRKLRRLLDMKGLRLQTERFSWRLPAYVKIFGVEPISVPLEAFVDLAQSGRVDAVETTVALFDESRHDRGAKIINNTQHFLLTTMLVINEKFYQSLPEKYRQIIARAARDAAREERRLSIKANEDGRIRLERRGVKFVDLTATERRRFEEALRPIYAIPSLNEGQDLIQAIGSAATRHRIAQR